MGTYVPTAGRQILDVALRLIQGGEVAPGLDHLVDGLAALRAGIGTEEWASFTQSICLAHPIRETVHLDPLTRRAYDRPRGYAGDPVVLDYMYGNATPGPLCQLGEQIHTYAVGGDAARSVRSRRDMLRELIDNTARTTSKPRILAIGCGHLRELEGSTVALRGELGRIVAMDHDPQTLRDISFRFHRQPLQTVHASIHSFVRKPQVVGPFDLIYSVGVFDYLRDRMATAVVSALFASLAPGGRLAIANFAPHLRDIGYMEAYMRWQLVYRTKAQLAELAVAVPSELIGDRTMSETPCGNIVVAEWRRSA